MFSDTNPNYFSDRDQSCGNVRLDYTIHTWESPNPAAVAQSRTTATSSSSDSTGKANRYPNNTNFRNYFFIQTLLSRGF